MTAVTPPKRDLFLITGIPGTGKTTFGNTLAQDFDFQHCNLEDGQTLARFAPNPIHFIKEILRQGKNTVVTWGFVPDHSPSVSAVLQFRDNEFKLVWFDGNRQAALRIFQTKAKLRSNSEADYYRQMAEFYLQMYRIETSKVVEAIEPAIINPLDDREQFKPPAKLLEEIRKA